MKKLEIFQQEELKQFVIFDTDEGLDSFIEVLNSGNTAWGKAEYQELVSPAVYDEETGDLLEEAVYETVPAEFTYEIEDVTEELENKARVEALKAKGALTRKACDEALDLIAGYNQDRELSDAEITAMTTTFAPILTLLSVAKRPGKAAQVISQVAVDGVMVTQEMKDDLLELLSPFLEE